MKLNLVVIYYRGPQHRPGSRGKNLSSKRTQISSSFKNNLEGLREVIEKAVISFCKKWCKRENADKKSLEAFINKCMEVVDIRINHFETHYKQQNTIPAISKI